MIELLAPALVACLLLAGILSYFGLHVLLREVIFVDLALAQLAALGAAIAHVASPGAASTTIYFYSFAFTLIGASIFSLLQGSRRVPQEALIGIVYAVSAALMVLVLSKIALDRDEIESMLTGRLLFVEWHEVGLAALLCAVVAVLHLALQRRLFEISQRSDAISLASGNVRLLDFVFYASFGVVVTSSVQMAGVLVVFSLLIVPAACAAIFFTAIRARVMGGWLIGAGASAAGLAGSAIWDLPTGASVVAALGVAFGLSTVLEQSTS
jgi:zinc/manganese transport system permease protein